MKHTHHAAKAPLAFAAMLGIATAAACSAQKAPMPPQTLSAPSQVTVSAQEIDDQSFCDRARQAGITGGAVVEGAADPATLLVAVDQLVGSAPPSIHDDFVTFDKLEHATIDPDHADAAVSSGVDPSAARAALTHVRDYLKNVCGIG